jgi:hypothetical protein
MLQPLQARYAMLKPEEIRYGTDRGIVSSSEAFLSGDWRRSQVFIRYPNQLCVWVNGNATESWRVEHQGTGHDLPPFGWLAVGTDGFFESSETVEGTRCDRATTADCLFLDGRGAWREYEGIGTSGSVAVRPGKASRTLSITTIEGVDRLVLGRPRGSFDPKDVRTALGAIAQGESVVVRAVDSNEKDLGAAAVRRTSSGWEIRPPQAAVRLDVRLK